MPMPEAACVRPGSAADCGPYSSSVVVAMDVSTLKTHNRRRNRMEQQWDFFKKSETSLGVFYPLHYIIAGYDSLDEAEAAEAAFRGSGVAADDVRAATGAFVAQQLESRNDRNLWNKFENEIVKFAGTEEGYTAEDKQHASGGGAFLFVYAQTDEDAANAKTVFAGNPPVFARRYLRIAIEQIVRNPKAP